MEQPPRSPTDGVVRLRRTRVVRTFLLTDIEASTTWWVASPAGMDAALDRHDHVLATIATAHGGDVFGHTGDGLAIAFADADLALAAACAGQRALDRLDPIDGVRLRVRMGIHTGPATHRARGYFGLAVSIASRVCDVAAPGTVVLTSAAHHALRRVDSGEQHLGLHEIRGLPTPLELIGVTPGAPNRHVPEASARAR